MAPWVWFIIAVLAAVAGGALLVGDYGRRTAHSRERRRWAALRGWRFVESDPVLPDKWRHGVIAQGGPGHARDLVVGRLFTSEGRRPVHVFDHEQNGRVTAVVVAVQRRDGAEAPVVELWLPSVPFPRDAGLELLGPVGGRYAFVADLDAARSLITPGLVTACDEVGEDVPVAWLEQEWVLAAAPAAATPARLERLLRALGEIADHVDAGEGDGGGDREHGRESRQDGDDVAPDPAGDDVAPDPAGDDVAPDPDTTDHSSSR
ncbi:MAG: hypothetical protein GEV09_16975 [Pseudonocardiaceae bacterium]|nr:hypothetical protein [Pseudonocardiaceae bacterium]